MLEELRALVKTAKKLALACQNDHDNEELIGGSGLADEAWFTNPHAPQKYLHYYCPFCDISYKRDYNTRKIVEIYARGRQ